MRWKDTWFPKILIPGMAGALWLTTCESDFNEPKISTPESTESHFWMEECLSCHRKGGPGEGWFTVAGSVRWVDIPEPATGVWIELWNPSTPGTQPVYRIAVDQLGNFYTTEEIDWGTSGLQPAIYNPASDTRVFMSFATRNGACNSCHAQGTGTAPAPPIWAPR